MSLLLAVAGFLSEAANVVSEVVGGGIGHGGSRKKRTYIERDGKILVFESPAKVAAYLDAERLARKPQEQAQEAPQRAIRAKAIPQPSQVVTTREIVTLASLYGFGKDIQPLIDRHELDALMALYWQARERDEEDIELLLLAL